MSAASGKFRRCGRRLTTPSGRTIEFPHPIGQMLAYGSVAVVLMDPAGDSRNVYGIDRRGETVWRLRKSPFDGEKRHDPFVEICKMDRDVRVFSWRGQIYDVDPRTGKVLGSGWTK